MFLKKSKKSHKGNAYETFALTESYREGGKVKHKHIVSLGALTPDQAERIRFILKATKLENCFVGHLSDLAIMKHYKFLDVAVLDNIWKQFDLDYFYDGLPYAEAMAINRCVEPKTKINIKKWAENTVLSRLQGTEIPDEYEVYRTLDKMSDQEECLQKHLFQKYHELGITSNNTIFYDITSSYFEGSKCILAAYGYSRDHRPDRKQIVIALVITPEGYPLYWQVMPGNVQDVTTVEALLIKIKGLFGIKKCLLVFDRGMVSADNLKAISDQKLTYITALDKDEIRGLGLLENDFPTLLTERWEENLIEKGFHPYDKNLYCREHYHMEKRYILAFNRLLYLEQQESIKNRLQKATQFIDSYNDELSKAKKNRNQKMTESKIEKHLRKCQIQKVFSWHISPLEKTVTTAKGPKRKVKTFRITYSIDQARLHEQGYLSGIICFMTNDYDSMLTTNKVVQHYRRKNIIEDAFREIKCYLRLRPFHLTREKRVKAHVTVCVLGYLMLNAMENKLSHLKQPPTAVSVLEILGSCQLNRISPKDRETYIESITQPTIEQIEYLKNLGVEHIIDSKNLENIMGYSAM